MEEKEDIAVSGLPEYCSIFQFPLSSVRSSVTVDISTFQNNLMVKTIKIPSKLEVAPAYKLLILL